MSGEIKAGITLMAEFEQSTKSVQYKGFLDYMDRPEASKIDFENEKIENDFFEYNEYMGNPEKSEGLFTNEKDFLTDIEKEDINKLFNLAQKNGSIMEKLIFSFDPRWLQKHNLLDDSGNVNAAVIMDYTRKSLNTLKSVEKGLENFIWTASIHHNTDNLHIHVAMVELNPSEVPDFGRCRIDKNGNIYQRGMIKEKSIEKCKSTFVNEVINSKEYNKEINDIVRERMINTFKSSSKIQKNKEFKKRISEIKNNLPENLSLWKYNMNVISDVRPKIDDLTDFIISNYFENEYTELKGILKALNENYNESYGKDDRNFEDTKLKDLHERFGNTILNSLKNNELENRKGGIGKNSIFKPDTEVKGDIRPMSLAEAQYLLKTINRAFKKDFQSMKNQYIYERTQMEREL